MIRYFSARPTARLFVPIVPILLWALLAWAPLHAEESTEFEGAIPAVLNADEASWLQRAEDYFNSIDSIRAVFFQTSSEGGTAEGVFYLSRPGRLRVEYLPPTPVLIVGDGLLLHFHDTELGQVNDWPIFDTPLGALSSDEVKFNDDLIVTEFRRRSGALAITLVKREDPGLGSLTLFFSEAPMELKQWKVIDAQGLVTTVALLDAETNIVLDNRLFVFDDPREARQDR
ncbi:MAG: outer membrane lipoprotein carrier protein LolA [Proteobacteria bacterium]|nr:outer membrane lipoprotein carrier protein LolA [Pseudomonadota bacterium]MDA1356584.1 outer membrane lipoprotein carrier protein LolA [Pseudomonadota bacterium]